MLEAADKFGAPLDSCRRYKQQLADAGFVDIVETIYKWPTSGWPKDPKYKEIGEWTVPVAARYGSLLTPHAQHRDVDLRGPRSGGFRAEP